MREIHPELYWVHSFDTPFSPFHVAFDPDSVAVRASAFASTPECLAALLPKDNETEDRPAGATGAIKNVAEFLDAYISGSPKSPKVDFSIEPSATAFQKRIWNALGDIGYGDTLSYQQLASIAGSPTAYRAAGNACGANRLALFIPCHRVVSSTHKLGGFRWGSEVKASLLNHELSVHQ